MGISNLSKEKPLTPVQEAVITAIYDACHGSLSAHVPEHAILARFRRDRWGEARKALDKLRPRGYYTRHPTRGEITYRLTAMGKRIAEELLAREGVRIS